MKNKILLLLLPMLSTSLAAELEIRDASDRLIQGYTESVYESGKKQRTVYLDSVVLISSKDVEDTSVTKTGDTHEVSVVFTDEGSKKLKEITEQRIRKQLAIIVNGEVLSAPTIMAALSKNVTITGSYTKAEAEDLAKKILNHN
jgi:preprotein translocase subunit SecD